MKRAHSKVRRVSITFITVLISTFFSAYGEIPERVIIGGFVDADEEDAEGGGVAFGAGSDSDSEEPPAGEEIDWNKQLEEL